MSPLTNVLGLSLGDPLALAERVVERQSQLQPDLDTRFGPECLAAWTEETRLRLLALAEAVGFDAPELFVQQIRWSRDALFSCCVGIADLEHNLHAMQEVLAEHARAEALGERVGAVVAAALRDVRTPACGTCLEKLVATGPLTDAARRYALALLEGRRDDALAVVMREFDRGVSIADLYAGVLRPALADIGRLWQMGEVRVHEEHYATAATQTIMARLMTIAPRAPRHAKAVLALSVSGDLHELGIRMVADLFELAGWRSNYLGADVPADEVPDAAITFASDLIAVSSKLVFHVGAARRVIDAVRADPRTARLPVLVGGMPFESIPGLWQRIGADAFAPSAEGAVRAGARLVGLADADPATSARAPG